MVNETDVAEGSESMVRWLPALALVLMVTACSAGGRPVARVLGATVTTTSTTPKPTTSLASTTTSKPTTTTTEPTTPTTTYDPNLQDHLVAAPAGYSYASSVGDVGNPKAVSAVSGEIQASDVNLVLGIPTAATNLGFRAGYGQMYQDDSAPASVYKSIELDLYTFDTAANATKFVQQMDRRSLRYVGNPRTTLNVVAGVPGALSVDDTTRESPGVYLHRVFATKANVAFVLWFADLIRGPSAFLRSLATGEYAIL